MTSRFCEPKDVFNIYAFHKKITFVYAFTFQYDYRGISICEIHKIISENFKFLINAYCVRYKISVIYIWCKFKKYEIVQDLDIGKELHTFFPCCHIGRSALCNIIWNTFPLYPWNIKCYSETCVKFHSWFRYDQMDRSYALFTCMWLVFHTKYKHWNIISLR